MVNALTVFIYSLFGGDNGITVSGNIPKTIKAGQEVPIEIKVAKGSMSGFAKLQIELPEGLSLKESDNRGASFSYSDGLAKWVWASLPSENTITVKAILVAESSSSGIKTIGAKYSFVENNAKQVVEMVPIEITVESESGVTTTTEQNTVTTSTETPTNTETNTVAATNSNKEPEGNVTVIRTIAKGASEGEYIVNLKIKKGATKGFARYSDDIPEGITAKAIKTDASSFSVADGKVKFVWVSVLPNDELELIYSMSSNKSIELTLNGEYSYLEDNQSKKFSLTPEQLVINLNTSVATNTETQTTQVTPTETLAVVTPTEEVATSTETTAVVTSTESTDNNNANSGTDTNSSTDIVAKQQQGNINYMVQIGAFSNGNVTASALKRKFRISEQVRSEMSGGLSKFMIGSHNEYKDARDQRDVVRNNNGVDGAFVVAYNQSKRITVQEALMISNQKWYK